MIGHPSEQPDLNWRNPEVRRALLDVLRFRLERGVDGFRLDVVNLYAKDALLRDSPRRRDASSPIAFLNYHHIFFRDDPLRADGGGADYLAGKGADGVVIVRYPIEF